MSNFEELYSLWDEFLSSWPASRLAKMTLDEYSKAGSKESFTYWLESGLDELGSIWGGSAFKFGVFSRKSTEDKSSDAKLSYSDTHGWYSSLGSTAEEAFEKVRGFVVEVVHWAEKGDLESIDAFEHLGEAFKWKIAFHYQNRQSPVIVPIFKPAWLASYLGSSTIQGMAALQKAALTKRPNDAGILEFGRQIWEVWSQKNLVIWKLSHGAKDFSANELQHYLQARLAVMHGETAKGQGRKFQEVPVGTLFYLCHGNASLPLVGQFISASEPCDSEDGWVQRHYRILKKAIKMGGYQDGKKGWTPNYNSTFKQVPAHDLPEFEAALLKPYFGTDLAELAKLAGESMEIANVESTKIHVPVTITTQVAKQPVANCFNRIYYGPPGTGKTYALMQLLKSDYETQALAISADQWRSQIIVEKVAMLTWWEVAAAALYDLGEKATVSQLLDHPFVQAVSARSSNQNRRATLWGNLQAHTIEESKTVNYKRRSAPFVFDKSTDSIWQLAGDWQETCTDLIELVETFRKGPQSQHALQRYSFVTFHQSYGYEEFVEGLRPVLNSGNGEVEYEIRSGVFKELCFKARQSPDQRFAIVIDEINRGNISKIFGELITLIESDKRDPLNGNPPPLELILAYSGEKFSVPANVDIIGTMNTADRSLAQLDTALRRRFDFVPLLPDTRAEKTTNDPHSAPLAGLQIKTEKGTIDVRRMLQRINERIEALYNRDHCIGHAYFTSLGDVSDGSTRFDMLTETFRKRIVPLLEEYFFEDWRKIRLVLGDNQKPDTEQFITESDAHEQDLIELFGNDHGLDSYATRRRYQLQSSAFVNPAAYIGIYQAEILLAE
ncbi:TPA: AAA family ATPase [Klebsiella pneumoniae]|uniref:AAA family ATPase n=2 Tax=Klebsiella/Raoultella group TaxID=2890311 RepID=A0A9Q9N4D8_RAOOR|nr:MULTISPECIES: AAA family ATPase [Klebsiella/Raoultella group]UXE38817.1 AAA family ATPase [Raoultella ornithinolytica]HBZ7243378.1 AAA family ATPase [Klebsiella pneumoniae]